jgi:hypothetical protein
LRGFEEHFEDEDEDENEDERRRPASGGIRTPRYELLTTDYRTIPGFPFAPHRV